MSGFDYKKNRIINGECEWCGIPAAECQHYKDNPEGIPMDETERQALSAGAPVYKNVVVPPLTEEEKADSLEESLKKKAEYEAVNANTQLNDPTDILDDSDL